MEGFLRGALIGFSIAAPVGQIGILCIRRTLAEGRVVGLVSGAGAATADLFYGFVAAFGITLISGFIQHPVVQLIVRLFGGLFLLYIGYSIFRSKPTADTKAEVPARNLTGAYFSTFALTITNPATIILYTSVFATLSVTQGDYGLAAMIVLGVFSGSMLWWVILSLGVGYLRTYMTAQYLRWINMLSGLVLVVIGLLALVNLITPSA
jgi:threonine/homoserine/homoserine lactone efflux protein